MRAILCALAAVACISPVQAAPDFAFRGQWNVTVAGYPAYVGIVLIDGQKRVTWDSPSDGNRPAKFLGYVRASSASLLEMVMTDHSTVATINCIVQSNEKLHCTTTLADGRRNPMFTMTRVGPGPVSLIVGK